MLTMLTLLSRLLNTALLGDPREPLSARMGRHIEHKTCPICLLLCLLLAWIEPDHCAKSLARSLKRLDAQR